MAGQAQEEVVFVAGHASVILVHFGNGVFVAAAQTTEFLCRSCVVAIHAITTRVRSRQREAVEEVDIRPGAQNVTRLAVVREL